MPNNSEFAELIRDVKEQVLYLQELGVEHFDVSLAEAPTAKRAAPVQQREERFIPDELPRVAPSVSKPFETSRVERSRLASIPTLSKREPAKPNVPGTVNETSEKIEASEELKTEALFEIPPALPQANETIESIRAEIGNCTRCPLHEGRTQIVHSTGNFQADLMFVGEAPGADEDEQGFPFVGRAGQLLTKIIEGIGIKREDVFIGNINRCRPPGNRQPVPLETAACRPYLLREVAVVRPKVIVVLGNTATQNLLDIKTPISKLRGNFQDYFGVKVMPTFHPAYLLRDPHKKREVWEDMKKVRDYLTSLQ